VLGKGLVAVARRLEPAAARTFADKLLVAIPRSTDPDDLTALGDGLTAAVRQNSWAFDQPLLDRAAKCLLTAISKTNNVHAISSLVKALVAVSEVPPPNSTPIRIGDAADRLLSQFDRCSNPPDLLALTKALATMKDRLDPPALEAIIKKLLAALLETAESSDPSALAGALTEVAGWRSAASNQTLLNRVAQSLVPVVAKVDNPKSLTALSEAMCAIASRMQTNEAQPQLIHAAEIGLQTINRNGVDGVEEALSQILSHINDRIAVAQMLKHSACVGSIRRILLWRLEQLAFLPGSGHRQPEVVLASCGKLNLFEGTGPQALLAAVAATESWQHRRFRTVWDAVAWLRQHEPDLDLDAPYRPRPKE
jgi:hypothetical protein